MRRDDSLWKGLLEDVFDDFLTFFFKEKAKIFDFDRGFEFLNNELAQLFPIDENAEHPVFVDKLVKVFTTEGKEEWVLVHVEVQGYNDKDFAQRMFTYFYRILDKYNKRVTCIAIFTGSQKKLVPDYYSYEFLGTENHFKYNVYKIIDQNRDELNNSDNPFALVILTVLNALHKGELGEEELLLLQTGIAKSLFQKNIPKPKIQAIFVFLRYYVHFDNPENISKFDKEINLFLKKNTTMGIEELLIERFEKKLLEKVKQEIVEEKDTTFVKSLLTSTDFDLQKIANIASVPYSFVEKVKASMQ